MGIQFGWLAVLRLKILKTPVQLNTSSTSCGWVGAGPSQRIMLLCGSILQAGTCQILSLAENPRWSRVWQYGSYYFLGFLMYLHMVTLTYLFSLQMRKSISDHPNLGLKFDKQICTKKELTLYATGGQNMPNRHWLFNGLFALETCFCQAAQTSTPTLV